jgi:hypothetical protein
VDAHAIGVSQGQRGPVDFIRTVEIRFIVSRLGPVKVDFCMGTITERFIFRMPAPAQGVLFLQGYVVTSCQVLQYPSASLRISFMESGIPPETM